MARLETGYPLPTREQTVPDEHDPGRPLAQARREEQPAPFRAGDSPVTGPRAEDHR